MHSMLLHFTNCWPLVTFVDLHLGHSIDSGTISRAQPIRRSIMALNSTMRSGPRDSCSHTKRTVSVDKYLRQLVHFAAVFYDATDFIAAIQQSRHMVS